MTTQEIEIWVRDIFDSIKNGYYSEDSKVEIKSNWINFDKAAERLAGHANASRGENILWIIGIDEDNKKLTNIDPIEKNKWLDSIQKRFDGFAPRLLLDVNIRIEDKSIVALYFNTSYEAPYVVKNTRGGGFPQYIVPWRAGTKMRAARRDELLRILIPIWKLSSLLEELEFNLKIAESARTSGFPAIGCPFREVEFNRAMEFSSISSLPDNIRSTIKDIYVKFGKANLLVQAAITTSQTGSLRNDIQNNAQNAVISIIDDIKKSHNELQEYLRKDSE